MTIQTTPLNDLRPLHFFDGELGALHGLMLELTDLLMYQMEQTLHALDFGDIDLALKVVARDRKVDDYRTRIGQEAQRVLTRNTSLASDLKTVMIIVKMTDAMEKIGNEIVAIASQLQPIFDRERNCFDLEIISEIMHIGGMIKIMLDKMTVVLETRNSNQAYKLMQCGWNCDTRLQQAMKQQLTLTIQNTPAIEHALDFMQLLKALERCACLCRNIAGHQILMLDSIDMRRPPLATLNGASQTRHHATLPS